MTLCNYNSSAHSTSKRGLIFRAGLIAVLVMLTYLPALRGGYVWDDDAAAENPHVRTPGGLLGIWTSPSANLKEKHYWPMVYTSFWLEDRLWGLSPSSAHLINALLHAANSILIGLILSRVGIPGGWLAAGIFALHPTHVESVAWIIERKDLLSGLFYILAFASYLRFVETKSVTGYALAMLLFVFAMLSKSIAVSFPAALLIWLVWRSGRLRKADILPLIPVFVLALAIAGADVMYARSRETPLENAPGWAESLIIPCRAALFYAYKLVWPFDLAAIYPKWAMGRSDMVFVTAVLVAFLTSGVWAWRKQLGRDFMAGILFYLVTLAPILGFIPFGYMRLSFVADRFQYLASLGGIVVMSAVAATGSRRIPAKAGWLRPVTGGVILFALGCLTWRKAHDYASPLALWSRTLALNPKSWTAHGNLGYALLEAKEEADAIPAFQKALEIKPDYENAHNGLGRAFLKQGRVEEAMAEYEESVRLSPLSDTAHNGIGLILEKQGKIAEAIRHYRTARVANPYSPEILSNLGAALISAGEREEGMTVLREALRISPYHPDACANMAMALEEEGKTSEALAYYERALKQRPDHAEAQCNAGGLLARMGRMDEAVAHLREAIRLKPDYAEARANLGTILARLGNMPEAVEQFEAAIRLAPGSPDIYNHAGMVFAQMGRADEAIQYFSRAVAVAPNDAASRENLQRALQMKK